MKYIPTACHTSKHVSKCLSTREAYSLYIYKKLEVNRLSRMPKRKRDKMQCTVGKKSRQNSNHLWHFFGKNSSRFYTNFDHTAIKSMYKIVQNLQSDILISFLFIEDFQKFFTKFSPKLTKFSLCSNLA